MGPTDDGFVQEFGLFLARLESWRPSFERRLVRSDRSKVVVPDPSLDFFRAFDTSAVPRVVSIMTTATRTRHAQMLFTGGSPFGAFFGRALPVVLRPSETDEQNVALLELDALVLGASLDVFERNGVRRARVVRQFALRLFVPRDHVDQDGATRDRVHGPVVHAELDVFGLDRERVLGIERDGWDFVGRQAAIEDLLLAASEMTQAIPLRACPNNTSLAARNLDE